MGSRLRAADGDCWRGSMRSLKHLRAAGESAPPLWLRPRDARMFARKLSVMRGPPIPQRIPPLRWRRPAFIWTPVALALAIGWPTALFYDDAGPQRLAVATLFMVFALALATLGASWLIQRAPKSRRIVVLHVVLAGVVAALIAPFVLKGLLAALARSAGTDEPFALALATTPLVLMLGLPVVLVSGVMFAWVALERPSAPADDDALYHHDVQPFK